MGVYSLFFRKRIERKNFLKIRAPIRIIPKSLKGKVNRKFNGNHAYLDSGKGKPIIFCHGLFGNIFNIEASIPYISSSYRFLMPYLPMYDMPLKDCTVQNLGKYLHSFISDLKLKEALIIGSSMGGGTALYSCLNQSSKISGLILCGSSGLSDIPMSKGFFKRKNFDFLKESTQDIFYNRDIPPDEMILDVYNAIQSYEIVLRSIRFSKAARKFKMHEMLAKVNIPTLLVWGRQDPITPIQVGHEFKKLLPNADLKIIDECGHVPTQEKPAEFIRHFKTFVKKIKY